MAKAGILGVVHSYVEQPGVVRSASGLVRLKSAEANFFDTAHATDYCYRPTRRSKEAWLAWMDNIFLLRDSHRCVRLRGKKFENLCNRQRLKSSCWLQQAATVRARPPLTFKEEQVRISDEMALI